MKIEKLDHVNVRTSNLDAMISWYTETLGLRAGDRPDFSFPGAWMYAGDHAVVHLVGVDGDSGAGAETALKLEHFALSATGRPDFEKRLRDAGEEFQCNQVTGDGTGAGVMQYNVWDPDGNHIHIDFKMNERV